MTADERGLWGLRALALVLAFAAWFFVSYGERENITETTVEPFVQYNPPRGHIILNPVSKVQVRLRGPASRIAGLNPFQVGVVVDLRDAGVGTTEARIEPSAVTRPEVLDVVSIEPNQLQLRLDREVRELKPVQAALTGEPAAGAIAQPAVVTPSSVLVSGPQSLVEQIETLSTTPVGLDGHAIEFEEDAAVVSPDPLVKVLQPAVVSVRIPLEIPGTDNGGGR